MSQTAVIQYIDKGYDITLGFKKKCPWHYIRAKLFHRITGSELEGSLEDVTLNAPPPSPPKGRHPLVPSLRPGQMAVLPLTFPALKKIGRNVREMPQMYACNKNTPLLSNKCQS